MQLVQNLATLFDALGPIFFMIGLGYVLRRSHFPGEAFWPAAERLTYFLLFPALLIHKLALAELENYAIAPLASVIVTALLLMTALVFFLQPVLKVDKPAFGSIYQGSIRFNAYVGLAAAVVLFGQQGAVIATLAIAILIPPINILCVTVLTRAAGDVNNGRLLLAIIRNPLILGCLIGVFLNVSGLGLPLGSQTVLDILAQAALPLGLLAVGAALKWNMALSRPGEIVCASLLKLMALPVLTMILCKLFGLDKLETAVLVLFAALPGAPSAYILARQLRSDAELMAAIVTVETGLSMVTLPIVLLFA